LTHCVTTKGQLLLQLRINLTRHIILLSCLLLGTIHANAQAIEGRVVDEKGAPIPFANIFIDDEFKTGTSTDDVGRYYMKLRTRGDYRIVVSAIGYTSLIDTLIVEEDVLLKNFTLNTSESDLEAIIVKANKRDPAYAIMRKVVDGKKQYLKSISSYRAKVYLKATEEIENLQTEKAKKKKEIITLDGAPLDPFEEQKKEQQEFLAGLNMIELEMMLNYKYPRKYKEERTAYKLYGSKDGLFIPIFGDADFNFYKNQVDFGGITETKIISPFSNTAVLSYKFKLEETLIEEDQTVYRIRVTPRKIGNATCAGEVFVNGDLWNINRLVLKLNKGGLKIFDQLEIEQNYEQVSDTTWLPTRQVFNYKTKVGKKKKFEGSTSIKFSDIEVNYSFSEKFFGNELAITTKEAYERDSTYWAGARVEPLTEKESKVVELRDSINEVLNSRAYKDSVEQEFNKVTLLEIFWEGVGFRSHEKQENIWIGSLPSLLDFEVIGGFRFGPRGGYFKRWESGKLISTNMNVNIGLKNFDLQGDAYALYRYAPMQRADVWASVGRNFSNLNDFDAILNQLRSSNYILTDNIRLGHQIELFNGLYLNNTFAYIDRQSALRFDNGTFLDEFIEARPAIDFDPYQSFIVSTELSFTPQQKFITEPNRKLVLGSKWPTFTLKYRKGVNKVFGSDIDFDYTAFAVEQQIEFAAMGNTRYNFELGAFPNSKDLRFVDIKRFNQSNFIIYTDPLYNFQLLDTLLTTSKPFAELHFIHHFNGALINNIPLVKKTNVNVVVGGGLLYVSESNYRYEELYAGLERVFKLGPRRRLRVGIYGVLGNNTVTGDRQTVKFSLDIIDTWKKDWSF